MVGSSVAPGGSPVALQVSTSPSVSSARELDVEQRVLGDGLRRRRAGGPAPRSRPASTRSIVRLSLPPVESVTVNVTLRVPASAAVGVHVKTAVPYDGAGDERRAGRQVLRGVVQRVLVEVARAQRELQLLPDHGDLRPDRRQQRRLGRRLHLHDERLARRERSARAAAVAVVGRGDRDDVVAAVAVERRDGQDAGVEVEERPRAADRQPVPRHRHGDGERIAVGVGRRHRQLQHVPLRSPSGRRSRRGPARGSRCAPRSAASAIVVSGCPVPSPLSVAVKWSDVVAGLRVRRRPREHAGHGVERRAGGERRPAA